MTRIRLAAAALLFLICGSVLAEERRVTAESAASPTRVAIPQSPPDGDLYEYY